MKPKAFISYAREDALIVERLATALMDRRIDVWLDSRDLLPGENWEQKITQALGDADFVLSCLSTTALKKTGYVQTEIRQAMKQQQLRPMGKVFLIPVLLGECPVPAFLPDIHAARLAGDFDAGVTSIVRSILAQWQSQEEQLQFSSQLISATDWLRQNPDQVELLRPFNAAEPVWFHTFYNPPPAALAELIARDLLEIEHDRDFDLYCSISELGIQAIESLREA